MTRNRNAEIAQETLRISRSGKYDVGGRAVDIAADVSRTNQNSLFISQMDADRLESGLVAKPGTPKVELRDESTLTAIFRLAETGARLGVLNFASAKNPGGGFLNGAMAQEECLASASALYVSQLKCPDYYSVNRAFSSFVYTDSAIWSPNVVFFRDDSGALRESPMRASVLTIPAVNYGQVLLKGEDAVNAKAVMKRRMKISLAIFADKGCDTLILGAYGCGVFRNKPSDVAAWWKELLLEYGGHFAKVHFAVLDRSRNRECIRAFENAF